MVSKLKWTFGNSKLSKLDTVAFDLPAYRAIDGTVTCPGASACAAVCYARQGFFTFRAKRAAMEFNLAATREANFSQRAIEDLARIHNGVIRIHASGDFYNQAYLEAWFAIARAYPSKIFYAYSKSHHLDFSKRPSNFLLTRSLGGKFDDMVNLQEPHSRIFSSHAAREAAGYVDGNENDLPAILGTARIGLVYHGNRKLTEAQEKHFS